MAALGLRPDLARAAVRLVSDVRSDAEVKRLEPVLSQAEKVLTLVEGRSGHRMGLLALTTERVLFRPHGAASEHLVVVPLTEVQTAESTVGRLTGMLTVRSTDSILAVDKILGRLAVHFTEAVLTQQRQRLQCGAEPVWLDPIQELVELRARRAAGTISASDFQAAKQRLMDEL